MAEDNGKVPMSPGLQATLLRAREYAAGQSDAQVLLEHLLLALSEDGDAAHVLEACRVDLARLRNDVAGYLGSLDDRVAPGTPGAPAISPSLTQVLRYATLAAQQGRRSSIDGAIVLAALVGDGRSMAASFLKAQGLTFDAAIQALRQAAAKGNGPPPTDTAATAIPAPARSAQAPYSDAAFATTTSAENILARARERVETRSQPRTDAPRRPAEEAPPPTHPTAPMAPTVPSPPPPAVNTPPPVNRTPSDDPAEPVGDRTSSPVDPFDPPSGPADPSPSPPDPGAAERSSAPPAPASRPNENDSDVFTASPRDAQSLPAAAPFAASGNEIGNPSKPPIPEPPRLAPQSARPEFRPDDPPATVAAISDAARLPTPTRQRPPTSASENRQPTAQAGWAPPPVRLSPPPQPAARAPAPPPIGWSTPPSPPGQLPRPPEPFQARPAETSTAPAQWSRPPTQLAPYREPPAAEYAFPVTAPPQVETGYASSTGRRPAIDPGQITHSIPRRLKLGRPHVIEIWIERPPIAGNSGSRSFALRPENVVARAIAVRLRPLSGKFVIDPASPETQWDQSGAAGSDRLASEAAVWRFTVTPLRSGRGVLQLGISARTLGADGVLAETQLPDQAHELRISRSYAGFFRRVFLVLGAAFAGMVLIKLVETAIGVDFYYLFKQLLRFRG